ncbi:hypothetical protein [Pectobacterium brasiliense]|uniref:hypothetical protein n=1 Tax=Pectobacterium brasiliense TaxID=180957 RepID=UPI0018F4517D|nr:hypothetical protein [Pectobacterium brasiliense]
MQIFTVVILRFTREIEKIWQLHKLGNHSFQSEFFFTIITGASNFAHVNSMEESNVHSEIAPPLPME